MPGKGIYDWFLVSYKNDDNNFIIEAMAGGLEKENYDNGKITSPSKQPVSTGNKFFFKFHSEAPLNLFLSVFQKFNHCRKTALETDVLISCNDSSSRNCSPNLIFPNQVRKQNIANRIDLL